jgi:hypothetical protein
VRKVNLKRKRQSLTPYEHKKSAPTGNPVSVNNSIRPGRCFNCNEKGHWRRECPQQTVDHGNKISICIFRSTNLSISSFTISVLSRADLLFSRTISSGMCKNGMLYPFSITSTI